jgi:hypothetical protein
MGIRDEEIARLKKYAQGLGLTVVAKKYRRGDPGATYDDETQTIELYMWPGQSKTRVILNFLHELGHHMDWVHNLRRNPTSLVLIDALRREWARTSRKDPVVPKSRRKLIYEMECRGIDYMDLIAKELGIKIPLWKIYAEQEYDKWIYYRYYQTGNMPMERESYQKQKSIYSKHKRKHDGKKT